MHGPSPEPGFDFTAWAERLCRDLTRRVPDLRHIRMDWVALSFSQSRSPGRHGLYASVTPLRFPGGEPHITRRGRRWGVQRILGPDGREMLYLMTFYLPRFLNLPWREKLTTVAHELWHIGPESDGQLRRFAGRCHAHGHSQKAYDARVEELVDCYLAAHPPAELLAPLRHDFRHLRQQYGRVTGQRIRAPKLIPLD